MKSIRIFVLAVSLMICHFGFAAETEAPKAPPSKIEQAVDRVLEAMQEKLNKGELRSREQLDPFFAQLDELYEKNKHLKTWDAAMPLLTAGNLWVRHFREPERAMACMERVLKDFAGTDVARQAGENIAVLKTIIGRQSQQEKMMEQQMAAMTARMKAEREKVGIFMGKPMPDFERVDSQGNPLSLSALKGHPTLMVFWASWCGPCMEEAPVIKAVYEKYKSKGLRVIGINKDRTRSAMQRVVDDMELGWPQYHDADDKMSAQYAAAALPTIYLIDAKGNLVASDMAVRGPNLEKAVVKVLGL